MCKTVQGLSDGGLGSVVLDSRYHKPFKADGRNIVGVPGKAPTEAKQRFGDALPRRFPTIVRISTHQR